MTELVTERLLLRQWNEADFIPFAKMNTDPMVMEFYPNTLPVKSSNAMATKIQSIITKQGWGFWAVELLNNKSFIGFVGLNKPGYKLPVSPCVEIGWRISRDFWGNGFATEAATASLNFAFTTLKLSEVYSFTSVANRRSRSVMERLNMVNIQSNFNHPMIPKNHSLSEHVLYKIDKEIWSLT